MSGTDNNILLKYICFTSVLISLILWITVYDHDTFPLSSDENFTQKQLSIKPTHNASLCTIESFNKGKWIYSPTDLEQNFTETDIAKVAGYHCLKKFAHRCFRRGGDELIRAKQIMDYRWKPDTCSLLDMNPKLLAEHFVDHPILFVGDSITQLQFESLGCLLGYYLPNRHPVKSDLNGGNVKIRVDQKAPENGDTAAMAYIRSDYLLRLDDFAMTKPFDLVGTQLGSGTNYPWVHALNKFDYIVINTGPHWHTNTMWGENQSEDELLAAYKRAMSKILEYLDKNVKPHQKVWIRTTPYGHLQCSQFKEPQVNPIAPSGREGEYEWHLFHEFDLIWNDLLKKNGKSDPRFDIFDIATLSNQRSDAHSKPDRDCLHTCIPGPVDEWNRLLYHQVMKDVL